MTPEEALGMLIQLAPPSDPIPSPAGDWNEFEQRNGFPAPPDYRMLIDRYGYCSFSWSGWEMGWICLLDPFDPHQSLVEKSNQTRRHLRGMQRRFPEQEPDWPMWPDAGGFLPWATSIDGDNIGWWTVGPPEQWGTRYYGRDSDHFEMSGGACEFLVQLLQSELIEFADDTLQAQVFPFERDPDRPPPREPWIQLSIDLDRVPRQADRLTGGATAVFEDWATPARAAGLRIDPLGWHRELDEPELRPMFRIHFPPELADVAKSMIVDLTHRFGVGVRDVRDDEYARWWPELST